MVSFCHAGKAARVGGEPGITRAVTSRIQVGYLVVMPDIPPRGCISFMSGTAELPLVAPASSHPCLLSTGNLMPHTVLAQTCGSHVPYHTQGQGEVEMNGAHSLFSLLFSIGPGAFLQFANSVENKCCSSTSA